MSFVIDSSNLDAGLKSLKQRADQAIGMYAETGALKLQNDARAGAPWTDRTGAARQRLTGTSDKQSYGYLLTLAHGVYYGIYLELAMEKRWAIIMDTIRKTGAEIMTGFSRLMERMK